MVFQNQAQWMLYLGPIVMIISTLALRGNAISQITLYGGTTLQPMSVEGYVSDNFGTQNESGFPIGAMKLNLIISGITIFT
ncbi:hypothetical protein FACS1894218_3510 [Bacilli bacterium]|nr:hypothetical protein FACS1894218_3510 [Bacilli bacterium]